MYDIDYPFTGTIRISRYRWIILVLFMVSCVINFMQYSNYSAILHITHESYFHAHLIAERTQCAIHYLVFIIFSLPLNFLIVYTDLKSHVIISNLLTAAGALLKIVSVHPNHFNLGMYSQVLCALGQTIIICCIVKVASTWFGPNSVSTICGSIMSATEIGCFCGCLTSAIVIGDEQDKTILEAHLWRMMTINTVLTGLTLLLVILFFRGKPTTPPSMSQAMEMQITPEQPALKFVLNMMFRNRKFVKVLIPFGLSTGIFLTWDISMEHLSVYSVVEKQEEGFIIARAALHGGCISNLLFGFLLDKYNRFKLLSFCANFGAALAMALLTVTTMIKSLYGTYSILFLYGFFSNPLALISFELASELVYPLPESVACAVVYMVQASFAVVFSIFVECINLTVSDQLSRDLYTLIFMTVILFVSTGLTFTLQTKSLHRRSANKGEDF